MWIHSTIMKGESSLTDIRQDRTSVAKLHRWTPPEKPDVTFLFCDIGGHKSYKNTAHCFQVINRQDFTVSVVKTSV